MNRKIVLSMLFVVMLTACATQADLIAEYNFEDPSSGYIYDQVNSGTLKGATKVYDSTRDSYVLSCTGTYGKYVTLGTLNPSQATDELTIAAWVKWNGSTGGVCGILSKRTNYFSNMMWTFGINSSNSKLMLQSTYGTIYSTGTISADEWVHVAVTFDTSGNVVFYINGDPAGTGTGFTVANGTRAELCLGSLQGYWNCLNGTVDDVRVYDVVLVESDIEDIINLDPSAEIDLVAKYEFDHYSTTAVYDTARLGTVKYSSSKVYDPTHYGDVLGCLGTYYNYTSLGKYNPSQDTDELTISAWIKWSGSTGYTSAILSKRTDYHSNMMWTFGISSATHKLTLSSNQDSAVSTGTVPVNQWTHVAVTVDSDENVAFYIDGEPSGTATGFTMSNGPTAELCLGSLQNIWYCLNGYIDNMRIYDIALSEAAVKRTKFSSINIPAGCVYPVDGAHNIDCNDLELQWADDGDSSYYELYFGQSYDEIDDANDTSSTYKGEISGCVYDCGNLSLGEYFWRVDRTKNGKTFKGEVWSFTGSSEYVYPTDGAHNIDCGDLELQWTDNSDGSNYELYLGQSYDQVNTADSQSSTYKGQITGGYYDCGSLPLGEYFWRVDRTKNGQTLQGEVWSFSGAAEYVYPADGSYHVDCNDLELQWTDNSDGSSYELYFGQSYDLVNDANSQSSTYKGQITGGVYDCNNLSLDEYFWRVDRTKNGQTVKGKVYSFECTYYVDFIVDNHVQRPYRIFYPSTETPYVDMFNFNNSQESSVWGLSLQGCGSGFDDYSIQDLSNGAFKYYDDMKSITFSDLGYSRSDFSMQIDTRAYYGTTHKPANVLSWPGMIMYQDVTNRMPCLTEIEAFDYHIEVKLLCNERYKYTGYNSSIHCAQFMSYFTIQNLNSGSAGYRQFMWFGFAIYDDRFTLMQLPTNINVDSGTNMAVYQVAPSELTMGEISDGDWTTYEADLLPHMFNALEAAWDAGYLQGSTDPNDYYVGGMNIGWEVPGINNVEMQFRNFSVKSIYSIED